MSEAHRFPAACVASPHYLASAAGLAVLAEGGNALDAAIATNLTLGVVAPYLCGYGGDLFAIVWDGELHGYNGSGRAPAAATPHTVRDACGCDEIPKRGPHSVTVPGAVRGWFDLLERFGSRSFGHLASTALRYASHGFPLTDEGRRSIEGSAAVFTDGWAQAWRDVYTDAGLVLRQPDVARTIRTLSDQGPDAYYRGEIAEAIAATLAGHGALMTSEDLVAHEGDWVSPILAGFAGAEIVELPPNTQGVAALEAMRIVDGLTLPPEPAQRQHLLIEATKLALADRDAYLTDPLYMRIDAGQLLSDAWVEERRRGIDPFAACAPAGGSVAHGGTAYLCAADPDGMLVSLIQSNYMGFGSGVTVPGWGINLHNRGSYFSLDEGHANVIAQSKRPLHTLIPAMALRGGRPWLVFGTMGGDGQAQIHLQLMVRMLHESMDVQQAVSAPRWTVSPADWSVRAEDRFGPDVLDGLRDMGHQVAVDGPFVPWMGHAHAIELLDHGGYAAGTDPRAEGAALGL